SSMLRKIRSPSQSYQVGTVCGEPSRRIVAITAGFGARRSSSTSGGSGGVGTSGQPLGEVGERGRDGAGLVLGREVAGTGDRGELGVRNCVQEPVCDAEVEPAVLLAP